METSMIDQVKSLGACDKAIEWLVNYSTLQEAWDKCPRGDWMLWLLGRVNKSEPWSEGRKALLACCLDCTKSFSHLWIKGVTDLVEILRKWIEGKTSIEKAKAARNSLYAHTVTNPAAYGAYVAVYSACGDVASLTAVYSAYVALYMANYAANYAVNTAAEIDAIKRDKLAQCADLVRKHFPHPPEIVR